MRRLIVGIIPGTLIFGGLFIGAKSRELAGAETVTTERFVGEGELQFRNGV